MPVAGRWMRGLRLRLLQWHSVRSMAGWRVEGMLEGTEGGREGGLQLFVT